MRPAGWNADNAHSDNHCDRLQHYPYRVDKLTHPCILVIYAITKPRGKTGNEAALHLPLLADPVRDRSG